MNPSRGAGFKIIGADNVVYGPVELPTLVEWVKEERVTPETWVFSERDDAWRKAAEVSELKMFFQPKTAPVDAPLDAAVEPTIAGLKPSVLRRVKVLADLDDAQLQRFVDFMEVQRVRQFAEIVKQNEPDRGSPEPQQARLEGRVTLARCLPRTRCSSGEPRSGGQPR